jgi:hypothetical protein
MAAGKEISIYYVPVTSKWNSKSAADAYLVAEP